MLDIKLLRTQPDMVVAELKKRNFDLDLTEFAELDKKRREILVEAEQLKSKQNAVSKEIPVYKKEGKDVAPIFAEMKELSDKVKQLDEQVRGIDEALKKIVLTIPNIPNKLVPVGKDDTENYEAAPLGRAYKIRF